MITVKRTNATDPNFGALVTKLDAYLKTTDGEEHDFYHQFNGIQHLDYIIVLFKNNLAVACGAIKPFDTETVEIKRMYVEPGYRGEGLGSKVLSELEHWALELNYSACILETGKRQTEAVALYKKNKYIITANYGQYIGVENSICFKKPL